MSQNPSRFDVSSVNGVQHFFKSPFLVDRLRLKSRVLRFLPAWVSREKKKRREKKRRSSKKRIKIKQRLKYTSKENNKKANRLGSFGPNFGIGFENS